MSSSEENVLTQLPPPRVNDEVKPESNGEAGGIPPTTPPPVLPASPPPGDNNDNNGGGGGSNEKDNNDDDEGLSNPQTPLESARWLKSHNNISVIPIVGKTKFPRSGYPLKERLYTRVLSDEEIAAEFEGRNKGDINIGASTGRLSRLLSFDVDGPEGKKRFTYVVENLISPELRERIKNTYVVRTGSGNGYQVHITFNPEEFPKGDPTLANKIRNRVLWTPPKNLDGDDEERKKKEEEQTEEENNDGEQENEIRLKGEGGYVLFPCSVTDNEYVFIQGKQFVQLSKNEFLELREALKAVDVDEFRFRGGDGAANNTTTNDNKSLASERYMMDYATGEFVERRGISGESTTPSPEGSSVLPEQVPPATKSLTEEVMMDIASILNPQYQEPHRHYMAYYLGGWLRKRGVKYEHAKKVVEELAKKDSEELDDRLRAVADQYDKNFADGSDKPESLDGTTGKQIARLTSEIKGYNGLMEILTQQFGGDKQKAWRLLHEIDTRLPKVAVEKAESDKERARRKKAERMPNAKDTIVKNCKEFFVDQHAVPHIAVYRRKGEDDTKHHYRVMNIKEEKDDVKGWINEVYHADAKQKVIKKALDLGFSEEEAKKMARTVSSLNDKELKELYDWLRWEAKNSGVKHNLQIRIAGVNSKVDPNTAITTELDDDLIDTIYVDLTNDNWEAIKITAEGWQIVKGEDLPILFKRGANKEQIYPAKTGDYESDILDKYVALLNLRNPKHVNLFKKWFISLYWPATIPKPAPMPYGSWGAGKTFIFETVKDAVDPSSVLTTAYPKQAMELIQLLDQEYLAFFDNMPEKLTESRSDALSRVITGSGFIKRTLYENNRIERYNLTRVIGLNGISLSARKADLLSRALLFEISPLKDEIKKIDPEGRELKAILWRQYQQLKPHLFAYVLDTLVKVLKRRQQFGLKDYYGVKDVTKLPRMADWSLFCAVVSEEIALTEKGRETAAQEFIDDYYENINVQAKEAVEASPVAQCVIIMMADRAYNIKREEKDEKTGIVVTTGGDVDPNAEVDPEDPPWYEGISSHLLPVLKKIAKDNEIETRGKDCGFPANPSALGKKLRAVQASLASNNGIHIIFDNRPDHSARVVCIIRKELLQKFLSTRRPVVKPENEHEITSDSADRKPDRRNGDDASPVVGSNNGSQPDPLDSFTTGETTAPTGGENSPVVENDQNHAQNEGLRQDDATTGENDKALCEILLETTIRQHLYDYHGKRIKDYFTEDDFLYTVSMLPNQRLTEDKILAILRQLLDYGMALEFEPGKFKPLVERPRGGE